MITPLNKNDLNIFSHFGEVLADKLNEIIEYLNEIDSYLEQLKTKINSGE